MPRFAANLSWMFREHPLPDRFAAAAEAGFEAVEMQLPYDHPAEMLAERLRAAGLGQVMFNAPPGDTEAGEYGLAALPGRGQDFTDSIARALDYAEALGSRHVHVLAGIVPDGEARARCYDTYLGNLAWAAEAAGRRRVGLLIEPINTFERPGYLITRTDEAQDAVARVRSPYLGIQYDFHNAQLMEGNLTGTLRASIAHIRHMQIAGVPGRTPPDAGEMNYPYLFALIDSLGYDGWVGCEYRPPGPTADSLAWAAAYGIG